MYVREYIHRLSRNVLGLACCTAAAIYGVVRRQLGCVDRNAGANMW